MLQTGLQRRYSAMYQAARQMIEKGMLGDVTYVQAQWHRNPGWKMKEAPNKRLANWRLPLWLWCSTAPGSQREPITQSASPSRFTKSWNAWGGVAPSAST